MKKIFLTTCRIILLFSIFACTSTDEVENTSEKSISENTNLSAKVSNEELENFKNDEDLQIIIDKISDYKSGLENENSEQINTSLDFIVESSQKLKVKYGEEKIEEFFAELSAKDAKFYGTHDGNKCTRNLNGTTYWGQCSFWEEVAATFSAAFCPQSGGPFNNESYYICVQAAICRNC